MFHTIYKYMHNEMHNNIILCPNQAKNKQHVPRSIKLCGINGKGDITISL